MIVAKKRYDGLRYGVYGNHALDYERDESFVIKKKISREEIRRKQLKKAKKQLKLISMVFLSFCVGIFIVGRYAYIISLNNQCSEIKKEIEQNQKENERLKVKLLEYYNIKQIEKEATTELSMVRPESHNTVYLDGSALAFEEIETDKDENLKNTGLLEKIASLFSSLF